MRPTGIDQRQQPVVLGHELSPATLPQIMSNNGCEVMFMPWADRREEIAIGPFRIWRWDRSRVQDSTIANHLDEYFKCHVDQNGKPVCSVTIISAGDDFAPIPAQLAEQARVAVDMLVFSAIYPGVKATAWNGTTHSNAPTADCFQLVTQKFVPGDTTIAVQVGGTTHVGDFGKLRITRPWDRGGIASFPNEDLLQRLSRLFGRTVKARDRNRFARSLEWFRHAHVSGDGATPLAKVVMMATAFEILLIPDKKSTTEEFVQAVESRLVNHATKSTTRQIEPRHGKNAGTKQPRKRTLPGWWANEFYDLRSRIVHGDPVKPGHLKYKRWTHLFVADLVFGECLIHELYDLNLFDDEVREMRRCTDQSGDWDEQDIKSIVLMCPINSAIHSQFGWLATRPRA